MLDDREMGKEAKRTDWLTGKIDSYQNKKDLLITIIVLISVTCHVVKYGF